MKFKTVPLNKILILLLFGFFISLTFSGAVSAVKQPDLAVTNITSFNNTDVNQKVSINYTIKNKGTLSTKKGFNTNFYLVKTKSLSNSKKLLGTQYTSTLGAGKSRVKSFNVVIPKKTSYGSYYVAAVVDSKKVIKESKENNNNIFSAKKLAIYQRIDSGSKKVGIWKPTNSYEMLYWKTYKYSNSKVYIDGWSLNQNKKYVGYFHYTIEKLKGNKLKISLSSPYIKYMYGYSPIISHKTTTLTPVNYYNKKVKPFLKKYGFADPSHF